jgi:hypothetical protein
LSVKPFFKWLTDKYGPEEGRRRYEEWKKAGCKLGSTTVHTPVPTAVYTKDTTVQKTLTDFPKRRE